MHNTDALYLILSAEKQRQRLPPKDAHLHRGFTAHCLCTQAGVTASLKPMLLIGCALLCSSTAPPLCEAMAQTAVSGHTDTGWQKFVLLII